MKLGILALILGLIYILILYAALPLGLIAIVAGLSMRVKAQRQARSPEGPPPPELDEDGKPKPSLAEDATTMIWLGVVLAVVGGAVNAYRYFGI